MKKQKLYFRSEDDEYCYSLDYHLEIAKQDGLTEVELFEAIPDRDHGWCGLFGGVLITGESECGKVCDGYDPRNGKSGICKNKTHCHTWGDKINFKVQYL